MNRHSSHKQNEELTNQMETISERDDQENDIQITKNLCS